MAAEPAGQFVKLSGRGVTLRARICGEGPLVILVHGFPESWRAWRHQIPAIANAGFRVCALDLRGYGGSDKPVAVEAYDLEAMTGDIAAIVEGFGEGPAIVIGHDWGAYLAWSTALIRPEVVRAVAGLSVPFLGVSDIPFIDLAKLIYTDQGRFFYQVYFQEVGVAEAEFEADIRGFVRKFYYWLSGEASGLGLGEDKAVGSRMLDGLPDPIPFPGWMAPDDIDDLVGEFTSGGFRGPLNRYRNQHRDQTFLQPYKGMLVTQPSLYVAGSADAVLTMIPGVDLVAAMRSLTSNLRDAVILEGCGHWTQQERPDEVTRILIDWVKSLDA
jgi:pimeloyl-ACP methyl ester carboxylesterase